MIEYIVDHIPLAVARGVINGLHDSGVGATLTLGERDVAIIIDLIHRPLLDRLLEEHTTTKANEQ